MFAENLITINSFQNNVSENMVRIRMKKMMKQQVWIALISVLDLFVTKRESLTRTAVAPSDRKQKDRFLSAHMVPAASSRKCTTENRSKIYFVCGSILCISAESAVFWFLTWLLLVVEQRWIDKLHGPDCNSQFHQKQKVE